MRRAIVWPLAEKLEVTCFSAVSHYAAYKGEVVSLPLLTMLNDHIEYWPPYRISEGSRSILHPGRPSIIRAALPSASRQQQFVLSVQDLKGSPLSRSV